MAIKEQNSRIERMLRTLIGESKPDLDPRRFMNIPEAAAATGLSIPTLRSYCERGQIRHTKMGRRVILRVHHRECPQDHQGAGGRAKETNGALIWTTK